MSSCDIDTLSCSTPVEGNGGKTKDCSATKLMFNMRLTLCHFDAAISHFCTQCILNAGMMIARHEFFMHVISLSPASMMEIGTPIYFA
jgi:hypothetical protein